MTNSRLQLRGHVRIGITDASLNFKYAATAPDHPETLITLACILEGQERFTDENVGIIWTENAPPTLDKDRQPQESLIRGPKSGIYVAS